MKVVILGGGPAGLYCGLLLKKAQPMTEIVIIERNPAGATYGWGVVFSDRTLAAFREADFPTFTRITEQFVLWDAIDIRFQGALMRCGGHIFAGLARKALLEILRERCHELGVTMRFETEIAELTSLPDYDLLIAADGVNSLVRQQHEQTFRPTLHQGTSKYIWFGTDRVLDAFTFLFRENEHGLFQVHAYPFDGTTSTFIVETDEATWRRAHLDSASESESIAYCERLFADELHGHALLGNNSRWISFVTVKNTIWRAGNTVLLGDAAHTAHFSIGSGTKLAMEDAIALVNALSTHADITDALTAYELERRPVVELLQQAAQESRTYFEGIARYRHLSPRQFAFNLLTRSGRISYDDLRLRDGGFVDALDHDFAATATAIGGHRGPGRTLIAPPPWLEALALRGLTLPNRVVMSQREASSSNDGAPDAATASTLSHRAQAGAGLILTAPVAVVAAGRVTPNDLGLYCDEQQRACQEIVTQLHQENPTARIGVTLNHAGRRGAMQSRRVGLDVPLRAGGWPLVAPSAIAYTSGGVIPEALDRTGMERIRDEFAAAAQRAATAGFDLLQLDMAHGYLLASFLSPLSNHREDGFGGTLERRLRFPLEVVDAVRAAWPQDRPLAVALTAADCTSGGLEASDGVLIARALKQHGCDLITVMAGQTTPSATPSYRRGFLTPLSDQIRNEAETPTLVGGYLLTANEANTLLASGRADLCLLEYLPSVDEADVYRLSENHSAQVATPRRRPQSRQEAQHG